LSIETIALKESSAIPTAQRAPRDPSGNQMSESSMPLTQQRSESFSRDSRLVIATFAAHS